eukprot:TRINITY_DN8270_c0_g1_i1.p1 TRINITY_DN8270_c0_g1~~TRINITY_DN8270_c0_g1_i1.p1  ORF type:complete len:157 (-),score=19.35 TRINITY_DN8270_c0_g1_i1:142-612(-)
MALDHSMASPLYGRRECRPFQPTRVPSERLRRLRRRGEQILAKMGLEIKCNGGDQLTAFTGDFDMLLQDWHLNATEPDVPAVPPNSPRPSRSSSSTDQLWLPVQTVPRSSRKKGVSNTRLGVTTQESRGHEQGCSPEIMYFSSPQHALEELARRFP